MSWRARARSASLLFCAAIGAYLLNVAAISPLVLWVARLLRGVDSVALRLMVGALVIDGGKLLGLLPAAWLIGRGLSFRPLASAAILVGLTFGVEAIIASILQQTAWLWSGWALLACRAAMASFLVWLVALVLRRRRSPAPPPPAADP